MSQAFRVSPSISGYSSSKVTKRGSYPRPSVLMIPSIRPSWTFSMAPSNSEARAPLAVKPARLSSRPFQ